ncbi:unnamed protein product, partial [Mesorhabditis belari]|uniref:G-protein coupled receptors family 1 profile domain-containing protein n=1 Tax=Mesorhabditis belari TaxID=2138241 RepID=A0AAF3EBN6_9BILA
MDGLESTTCSTTMPLDTTTLLLEALNPVMITLATIALFANVLFLLCLLVGVQRRNLPVKRFLFVANRSCADVVTAVVVLVYLVLSRSSVCHDIHLGCTSDQPAANPLPLQVVITLDYWAVAGSYSGIALLTWYAVRSPLGYKLHLTSSWVLRSLSVGWAAMSGFLGSIMLLTKEDTNFDSNGMIYVILHRLRAGLGLKNDEALLWYVDLCHNLSERSQPQFGGAIALLLPVFAYAVSFFSYLLVSFVLYRRRQETRISKRHFACVWRLGMHMGLFTVTCALMAVSYYATGPMKNSCLQFLDSVENDSMEMEEQVETPCLSPSLLRYSLLCSVASVGWFSRMCLDPIIDLMIDSHLRRTIFFHKKEKRYCLARMSQSQVNETTSQISRYTGESAF